MSTNSEYDKEPSWVKENLSQLILLIGMLMIVVGFASYFFSDPLSELIFAADREATPKTLVHKAPAKVIIENWPKDELDPIENTQYSVGDSDLSGQRVVISKEELIGLEQRYRIDLVDREENPSADKMEDQQTAETLLSQNEQPNRSIIKMSDSSDAQLDMINGQAESFSALETNDYLLKGTEKLSAFNVVLTPAESLLAKSPSLFSLRLSEMETWEKVQSFVQLYDLPTDNIYIYRTIRDNKPWYVVLLGEYSSFPGAIIAQQGLPPSLSNLSSQVLTYKDIQQDLQLKND